MSQSVYCSQVLSLIRQSVNCHKRCYLEGFPSVQSKVKPVLVPIFVECYVYPRESSSWFTSFKYSNLLKQRIHSRKTKVTETMKIKITYLLSGRS